MTMVAAGIIGGVSALGSIVGGIFGSSAAKRRQREAAREKKRLQAKLTSLENSRQAIMFFNQPKFQFKENKDFVCTMYANFFNSTR